jgi:competence ComEA-like helix-hairpin-helix protein
MTSMSLTEELMERLGSTTGVGAAGVAALLLAPRVSRPVGRGLRALAKGAIKGYLIVRTRARTAIDEAADEWQSLYDQARAEIAERAPGRNGRVAENGAAAGASGEGVLRRNEEELAEIRSTRRSEERVNLNAADKETLMLLPGVGERTAEKILQYREEHGPIRDLKELQDADILFESTAEHLRDRVAF